MKYIVTINSKQYEVEVEQGTATVLKTANLTAPAAASVAIPGAPAAAPSAAPETVQAAVPVGDGEKVSAPMPGAILAVKVNVGQLVKKGDVLVVLEAMKMENDVVAPCDGVVEYTVAKGSQVNAGDLLALLK